MILHACLMLALALSGTDRPAEAEAAAGVGPMVSTMTDSAQAADVGWSADSLAALRVRAGRGSIRLWSRTGSIELRRATFDSSGIAFAMRDQAFAPWRYEEWQPNVTLGTTAGQLARIPWSRVIRIERRKSHVRMGILAGALVGLAAMGAAASAPNSDEGTIFIIGGPVLVGGGMLLGGITGGLLPGFTPVWARRPPVRP